MTSENKGQVSETLTDEEIINHLLRKITLQIELETRNTEQQMPNVKKIIH